MLKKIFGKTFRGVFTTKKNQKIFFKFLSKKKYKLKIFK